MPLDSYGPQPSPAERWYMERQRRQAEIAAEEQRRWWESLTDEQRKSILAQRAAERRAAEDAQRAADARKEAELLALTTHEYLGKVIANEIPESHRSASGAELFAALASHTAGKLVMSDLEGFVVKEQITGGYRADRYLVRPGDQVIAQRRRWGGPKKTTIHPASHTYAPAEVTAMLHQAMTWWRNMTRG